MKSFKNLVNQLAEDYGAVYTFGSDSDSLGSGSYDIHNIGNPENLKRLNQYIENFTAKSYFDPRQAVVELRAKLNTVGLDINVTQESAGEGSFPSLSSVDPLARRHRPHTTSLRLVMVSSRN